MASRRRDYQNLGRAIAFLLPNILGVLTFVVFPVVFSVLLAFTNWDLRRHNMFHDAALSFVGLANFVQLFNDADFVEALLNTLFMMMGIPFSVAGSLFAASLLSKDTRGGGGRVYGWLIGAAVLVCSTLMLATLGMGGSAMVILLTGVACGILLMGMVGGVTVYRTLFYTPHFTAGVATFILWKKLYKPEGGPINAALQPVLNDVSGAVNAAPGWLVRAGLWVSLGMMMALVCWGMSRLRRLWQDGDLGSYAAILGGAFVALPVVIGSTWSYTAGLAPVLLIALGGIIVWQIVHVVRGGQQFPCKRGHQVGTALMLSLGLLIAEMVMLGVAPVFWHLPGMASNGLEAPQWIHAYHWAKPSLMLVMFWAAVGSNNMLLYLAALTNIPPELYEASEIDGAGRAQRFWHVTWPQLAPTTFFIAVMSTIHGLKGGFEIAKTMTDGGPAGATTTMSYFIYIEGFETGRLSFAAATAWVLFMIIFVMTMLNWRFGDRYVND